MRVSRFILPSCHCATFHNTRLVGSHAHFVYFRKEVPQSRVQIYQVYYRGTEMDLGMVKRRQEVVSQSSAHAYIFWFRVCFVSL